MGPFRCSKYDLQEILRENEERRLAAKTKIEFDKTYTWLQAKWSRFDDQIGVQIITFQRRLLIINFLVEDSFN